MSALNQVDTYQPAILNKFPSQNDGVLMECSRLIHAAVVSKRFLKALLDDPIKSIEDGFCGEKFSFSHLEKQQITHIHATNLSEFTQLLLQALQQPCSIPATTEMVFAHI